MCLKYSAIPKGTEVLATRTATIGQLVTLMQQALEWASSSERDGDIWQLGEWTFSTRITVMFYIFIVDAPDNHSATLPSQANIIFLMQQTRQHACSSRYVSRDRYPLFVRIEAVLFILTAPTLSIPRLFTNSYG
jgi:hypothetical protein